MTSDSLQYYWFFIPRKLTQVAYTKGGEGVQRRVIKHPPPLPLYSRSTTCRGKQFTGGNRQPGLADRKGARELRKDGGLTDSSLTDFSPSSALPEKWPPLPHISLAPESLPRKFIVHCPLTSEV